jgi:hypothetical protein
MEIKQLAKFPLGQIVATPAAIEAMEESGQTPDFFLERHVAGDWGELSDEDKALNEAALIDGDRILSSYKTLKGTKLWVITEADRSVTTVLLPDDY